MSIVMLLGHVDVCALIKCNVIGMQGVIVLYLVLSSKQPES